MRQRGDSGEHNMVVGVRWAGLKKKLLIYWDFLTGASLWFTENGMKKRKYSVSCNSLGENVLLITKVGGGCANCFELIGMQQ